MTPVTWLRTTGAGLLTALEPEAKGEVSQGWAPSRGFGQESTASSSPWWLQGPIVHLCPLLLGPLRGSLTRTCVTGFISSQDPKLNLVCKDPFPTQGHTHRSGLGVDTPLRATSQPRWCGGEQTGGGLGLGRGCKRSQWNIFPPWDQCCWASQPCTRRLEP